MLLTFFQNLIYFSNNFSSFIKKDIHLVLGKISSICIHFWKEYAQRCNFFLAFLWPMKYLKFFLPKETLLDTTILLISILLIEKWLLFLLNLCISISVSSKIIIFSAFLYMVLYNFHLKFSIFLP